MTNKLMGWSDLQFASAKAAYPKELPPTMTGAIRLQNWFAAEHRYGYPDEAAYVCEWTRGVFQSAGVELRDIPIYRV